MKISEYKRIYLTTLSALEEIMQKRDTYFQKTVSDSEKLMDKKLGELEKMLRDSRLKGATSLVGCMRDILTFNYWADISEEAWVNIMVAIKRLETPERIDFKEIKTFYRKLFSQGLKVLPITEKAADFNYGPKKRHRSKK